MEIVVFIVFLAVAGGVLFWIVRANRRDAERYRAWASSAGWSYVGEDPSWVDRWRVVPFSIGGAGRVAHLMQGAISGRPAAALHLTRVSNRSTGGSRNTYTMSVAAVRLPVSLPSVLISPQRSPERMLFQGALGRDYEVEWGEFNREWWVRASDLRYTSDLIHPQFMERLMEPDARFLHLRIEGDELIGWFHGMRDLVPLVEQQGKLLDELSRLIPRFVFKDYVVTRG